MRDISKIKNFDKYTKNKSYRNIGNKKISEI